MVSCEKSIIFIIIVHSGEKDALETALKKNAEEKLPLAISEASLFLLGKQHTLNVPLTHKDKFHLN